MFKLIISILVIQYVFLLLNHKFNKYMRGGAQSNKPADWIPFYWIITVIKELILRR
jgi:hypothetical protein